ncbi:thioredoxin family protein [Bacillus sp. Marseille-Q3570]|uniref:thioredoxin family protein n=1 Tax=Bacillus sp. Marseille-Q3570 TaxID=2963522 RepID=UPI0021B72ACB|nr:thioredoxin fold domain-containing protein [Bacillus sp. Marseille-Q3570]
MNVRSVGFLSIPLLSIIALLSSCQFIPEYGHLPVDLETDEINTILFSSKTNQTEEKIYYDALLELQKDYPQMLNSIRVIKKKNKQIADYYNVSKFPTVIVFDGKDEIVRLEGKKQVEEIKKKLDKVYSK